MTLAWGGGGQRVMVVEELDLTIVISGHDRDDDKIMKPIFETVVPAFCKRITSIKTINVRDISYNRIITCPNDFVQAGLRMRTNNKHYQQNAN